MSPERVLDINKDIENIENNLIFLEANLGDFFSSQLKIIRALFNEMREKPSEFNDFKKLKNLKKYCEGLSGLIESEREGMEGYNEKIRRAGEIVSKLQHILSLLKAAPEEERNFPRLE